MKVGTVVGAEGIVLRYEDRLAVDESTFGVPGKMITAIIGPNGSGKSTLLNAVAGLHEPERGRLAVLGTTPRRARTRIAYVLQSTKVNDRMPVTVREVVGMGRYAGSGLFGRSTGRDRAAVEAAMTRLDIANLADRHLRELSAGQRQRVFVAQGLAQDRDLFLLDEPLTGLDLVSSEQIREALAGERRDGRTVILTTHDLAEAAAADHVLLLAGRVVATGPPEQVLVAERLEDAYGARLVDMEGRMLVDDAAHLPSGRRHVHVDRSGTWLRR